MDDRPKRPDSRQNLPALSIVVPMHNEEQNAAPCYEDVTRAMEQAGIDCEVIFVDDGSTDGTLAALREAIMDDPRATVVELRRNYGQASALGAGFDHARAPVVVALDGDLQNDPRDIPALLAKLDEGTGYDVVSGWRKERRDSLARRAFSKIGNRLISVMTGVHLHDYGCSLKAYRSTVLKDIRLYGEMHRFLPALIRWVGGRVAEIPVNHRPRTAGKSKYGMGRAFRVALDLITVKFMMQYITKPLYFFGKLGALCVLAAFGFLAAVIWQKASEGTDMTGNPLLYLSVALVIIGVQVVLMGLIMELLTRTYHESQGRKTYAVRDVYRGGSENPERNR